LIVYFGDLHWRSVGSVGHTSVWTHENDTGPDDANHAQHGIFVMANAGDIERDDAVGRADLARRRRDGLSLYDVAPTVLEALDVPVPAGIGRRAIHTVNVDDDDLAYSLDEEAELARR